MNSNQKDSTEIKIEHCENNSFLNPIFYTDIDKINEEVRIKPENWTDEFWLRITSKYEWIMCKDGYLCCDICFANKAMPLNKSQVAAIRMSVDEFSDVELNKNIMEHNASEEHLKSISLLSSKLNLPYKNEVNKLLTPLSESLTEHQNDLICQFCDKEYRFKKSLINHVSKCTKENNIGLFIFPCGCNDVRLSTICAIDTHTTEKHNTNLTFHCTKCQNQFTSAISLFEHFLIEHNHRWNPFEEMPVTPHSVSNGNNIFDMSDDFDADNFLTTKKVKLSSEILDEGFKIDFSDRNGVSQLKLPLDQIHSCPYCGGRYLSMNILNEHIRLRHPTASLISEVKIKSEIKIDSPKAFSPKLSTPKRRQLTNDERCALIRALENETISRKAAAKTFGISYTTVTNIYSKFCKTEEIEKKKRNTFKPKSISDEIMDDIRKWLSEDCTLTLCEIKQKISDAHNKTVSLSTISNRLSMFHFSLRRVEKVPIAPISDDPEEDRRKYCSRFVKEASGNREMLFIDEATFSVNMRRFNGRKSSGEPTGSKVPCVKTRSKTVMAAVSRGSLFHFRCLQSAANANTFMDFLIETIGKVEAAGKSNVLLILDRVFVDKKSEIERLALLSGHELLFLPLHSPLLSPIESLFSEWEGAVRSKSVGSEEELQAHLDRFDAVSSAEICTNFFNVCLRHSESCLDGKIKL